MQHDTGSLVFVKDFVAVIDDAKTYDLAPSEWRPRVADVIPGRLELIAVGCQSRSGGRHTDCADDHRRACHRFEARRLDPWSEDAARTLAHRSDFVCLTTSCAHRRLGLHAPHRNAFSAIMWAKSWL